MGFKHGGRNTRLYHVWQSMWQRCENKNCEAYVWYGAKGVKVCNDWKSFASFRNWAMDSGYDEFAEKGKCTLDRIDVYGDYEPSNCRWATTAEQNRNMRKRGASPKVDIGSRIKSAMTKNNIGRVELALETELTVSALNHYINNDRTPKADAVIKICKALNISSDWLLGISKTDMRQEGEEHGTDI